MCSQDEYEEKALTIVENIFGKRVGDIIVQFLFFKSADDYVTMNLLKPFLESDREYNSLTIPGYLTELDGPVLRWAERRKIDLGCGCYQKLKASLPQACKLNLTLHSCPNYMIGNYINTCRSCRNTFKFDRIFYKDHSNQRNDDDLFYHCKYCFLKLKKG